VRVPAAEQWLPDEEDDVVPKPDPQLMDRIAAFTDDGTVALWTARALAKAFAKSPKEILVDDEKLRHIVDWIAGALQEDDPWTRRTDAAGIPVKLLNIGTFDHACRKADKEIRAKGRIVRQNLIAAGLEVSGGETVMTLKDGWRIVRLTTPKHLDYETAFMDHCIGNGSYDERVETGRSLFYSLRDADNRPHATMEVVEEHFLRVAQCFGRGNDIPAPEIRPMLLEFFESKEADYGQFAPAFGRIMDVEGRLHDLKSIGPDFRARGPVWFVPDTDVALPAGMIFSDSVTVFTGAGITFADGTNIFGHLFLNPDSMESLPDDFLASNGVSARDAGIRKIGARFKSMGDADFWRCPIAGIGQGAVFGGDLKLSGCSLDVLPDLFVSGMLVLGPGVRTIGDNFLCRSLEASESELERIGDNVVVTNRCRLPASLLSIGRNFRTHPTLEISAPGLASIGDGLTVSGSLLIYDSSLEALPAECSIGRGLQARGSRISSLPTDLKIGFGIDDEDFTSERRSALDMKGSMLASLPAGFRFAGDVTLDGCPIEELPSGLRVGGDLYVNDTPLTTLPADMRVGLDVMANRSAILRLPDGLELLWLGLKDTPIAELPNGLVLKDGGDFGGTRITGLPSDIRASGQLTLPCEMELPAGVVATIDFRKAPECEASSPMF
jgi:hypothetical protein